MKIFLLTVTVLVALLGPRGVRSNAAGPPAGACDTLTPSPSAHGAPQTSEVPYFVYLDPLCNNGYLMYTPGQTYTLGVRPTMDGDTFRGFFVQSRLTADSMTRVGTFAVVEASQSDTRLSNCPTDTDGINHSNGNDKTGVYFSWTAPAEGTGPVEFRFAVVRTQIVHWANQATMAVAEAGAVNATGGACQMTPTTEAPTDGGPTDGAPQLNSIGFFSVLVTALAVAIKTAL